VSFVQREITVTLALGKGAFGESGSNTITLSGLRAAVQVEKFGSPSFNTAQARIYGVPLSVMNDIGSLWKPWPDVRRNGVVIQAGDAKGGMSTVFQGGVHMAWIDLQNQPEASLVISARAALAESMKPVAPNSYTGPADAALILQSLATQMGMQFENNGVQGIMLSNPYFPGVLTVQALRCAEAADIGIVFDDDTMAIWYPKSRGRNALMPSITPTTGLVGYPTFNGSGISLRTLYNPAVKFNGPIEVKSEIKAACGNWYVRALRHTLQSRAPGGAWFTEIEGQDIYQP
jgi:hypothetical protein